MSVASSVGFILKKTGKQDSVCIQIFQYDVEARCCVQVKAVYGDQVCGCSNIDGPTDICPNTAYDWVINSKSLTVTYHSNVFFSAIFQRLAQRLFGTACRLLTASGGHLAQPATPQKFSIQKPTERFQGLCRGRVSIQTFTHHLYIFNQSWQYRRLVLILTRVLCREGLSASSA